MIRVCFILLLSSTLWAGTLLPAQSLDTSFVPRGMDLSVNEQLAPAGTAAECLNWDLSKRQGSLVKRDGFRDYYSYLGYVLSGIFLYTNRDNEDRLIMTMQDTSTDNFQSLHVSPVAGANVSLTSALDYWYRDGESHATTYNNTFIIANGKNRPYYYAGDGVRPLVEVQPGGADLAPEPAEANTAQVLDGRYYYAWRCATPGSSPTLQYSGFPDSMNLHDYSWRINCDSQWVRVLYLSHQGMTISSSAADSTWLKVYRTRAGGLPTDSFFWLINILLPPGNPYANFIDSVPDDSLGAGSHVFGGFVDTVLRVADTTTDSLYKLGCPVWMATYAHATDSFLGISSDDSLFRAGGVSKVLYRKYMFAWYDSATGMLTQSGPILKVPVDTVNHRDTSIGIISPYVDTTTGGKKGYLWGILYRADVARSPMATDSTIFHDYIDITGQLWWGDAGCPDGYKKIKVNGRDVCYKEWADYFVYGKTYTIDGSYYPVCTVKTVSGFCDTIYDSFSISTLRLRDPYKSYEILGQGDYPVVAGDHIVLAVGNQVRYNYFGVRGTEIGLWPVANAVTVGPDDGDEITALHSRGDVVDIFKNYSWYQGQFSGANELSVTKVMSGVGCIAPYSVIDIAGGGIMFLGEDGVYYFSSHWQSQYKTSGGNIGRISDPVWPKMGAMGEAALRECYTWQTDDHKNVVFSFPTIDTSYVYSLTTGQWGKWDVSMRMSCLYASHSVETYQGDSDVVFIKDDSQKVYRWGGSKKDISDSVQAVWKSLPIYETGGYGKITGFGTWKYSDDTSGVTFTVYDIDGDSSRAIVDSTQKRFRWNAINPKASQGFQIEVKSKVDSLTIDRIDLRYQPVGPSPEY